MRWLLLPKMKQKIRLLISGSTSKANKQILSSKKREEGGGGGGGLSKFELNYQKAAYSIVEETNSNPRI